MPHEPKRRHSVQKKGKRRASISLKATQIISCPNCGAPTKPHMICKNCGYYKGSPVIVKKIKEKEEEKSAATA